MPLAFKILIWLCFGLALLVTAAFAVSSQKARAAETAYPPEGQFVDIDGVRVHALVAGSGPDLVLIHGSSGSTRDFTFRMVPALADKYRVIVFDRPGLGYTDPLPGGGSIEAQARLLQEAAARLGAEKPIVLGQSYGGAVALAWAVHLPETIAALVPLSSPSQRWEGGLDPIYAANSSWWGPAVTIPLISAFVPQSYTDSQIAGVFAPQPMPDGFERHIGAGLILRRHSLRANALQRANLKEEITELMPRYGEIAIPVEMIHGDADDIVPLQIHAAPLSGQIPGAVLTTLDGIGHMPQHVAVEATVAGIDRAALRAGLR